MSSMPSSSSPIVTGSMEQQLLPATTEGNNSIIRPSTAVKHRLSSGEQFMIGIISGGLSALGLSPVRWILCLAVIPAILLELWETFQITYGNPDMNKMKQLKKLRIQQFGHGVISGSGVSRLVADMIFQPSMYTVLNCIMYICISICWTLYWTFPSFTEFQKVLTTPPSQQHQDQTMPLPFFSDKQETKSSPLLKKTSQRRKGSKQKKFRRSKISLPLGEDGQPRMPRKKVRVATVA